ncbi:hypothetical protein M011DRAFT_348773 [Sporormia fimetaria CBS 119925]|uniref:Uncharacterized protein n=1 Tax=Sporormia fimetaria CBS 119925 TaxID=1340428 RepID=A0A6A6VH61_9PLEO|nr:hypothetical protein M011DRAFT_348773 [Sporormia fimetaria CBS 119925]
MDFCLICKDGPGTSKEHGPSGIITWMRRWLRYQIPSLYPPHSMARNGDLTSLSAAPLQSIRGPSQPLDAHAACKHPSTTACVTNQIVSASPHACLVFWRPRAPTTPLCSSSSSKSDRERCHIGVQCSLERTSCRCSRVVVALAPVPITMQVNPQECAHTQTMCVRTVRAPNCMSSRASASRLHAFSFSSHSSNINDDSFKYYTQSAITFQTSRFSLSNNNIHLHNSAPAPATPSAGNGTFLSLSTPA